LLEKIKSTLRAIVLDGFDLIPFKPVTFCQQQKISNQKMPPLLNFLAAQNQLSAKPMLLICSRIYVRQLFLIFSRSS
jgi:hypothetical protein